MLDLETGKRQVWDTGIEAHPFDSPELLASDRYVGLLTDKRLAVWDTNTSQECGGEVPFFPNIVSIVKDKVVMTRLKQGPPRLFYDVDENLLVTFEIDWDTAPPEVQQTNWTLAGQLLDKKRFLLSLSGRHVDVNSSYSLGR
ncbi:hypothetical protein VTN49DRAFT_7870 [Thermomyces lanuginosus]|uniref:uncharacterized protein n=1 Tax=Thermomyces lanuginosus TaxID=5541 RepID=UPI003741E96A